MDWKSLGWADFVDFVGFLVFLAIGDHYIRRYPTRNLFIKRHPVKPNGPNSSTFLWGLRPFAWLRHALDVVGPPSPGVYACQN